MNTPSQDVDIDEILIARIRALSSPMTPQPTGVTERLTPLPDVRAVIFDVYGTLFLCGAGDISVNRAMSNAQAMSAALAYAGFSGKLQDAGRVGCQKLLEAIEETHAARRAEGIDFPEVGIQEEWTRVLAGLQEQGLLDDGIIRYDAVQKACVDYELRVNPVWPVQDVEATLRELWNRDKLLGIASNAQFYTLRMFQAFFGKSCMELGFNPFLCAFSYELREAKPSLKIFQKIIDYLQQEFKVSAAETLYVGNDMLNDVWTASQCGLKTALFAGDKRSLRLREDDARCAALQPDVIVTSLSQILDVVGTTG